MKPLSSSSPLLTTPSVRQYGLAVASVAAALALALLGEHLTQKYMDVPPFLMAIAITVWYTTAGPTALAIVLSALAFDYFITEPKYSFSLEPGEVGSYVIFLLFAVLISWFVTKRRRIEQQLRQALGELDTAAARTRQARLLDLTHDTIFVRDMSDVITYWNLGAQEFYGWKADELVGKVTSHQLLHTVFPAPAEQIHAEFMRTGHWEGELIHTKRDGAQVVVASRWSMERDEHGRPLATLETNNDITERKRAEDEIRKINAELEQRVIERTNELRATNKELEAFAYSTSHDLRAPLRHVVGYSELLQKHAASLLDDKSRRYVTMIRESATRMGVLIDDLLAFSRIGRAETQNTLVSLGQLVGEVRSEVERETEGRDIAWNIDALPSVFGDRAMLRVALVNLISNAVKFTGTRPQATIDIGCADGKQDEVVVFVKDNGVGFDMKYVHKLFGVFQRLHKSEAFEGTGIGLATVQRVVARHGGRVWATSEVDKGAAFYFSLPKP
jgi:PAS domain S-box-containing protein